MISVLRSLRRELHEHPELSGQEVKTAARIRNFIQEHNPTEIIENIGGPGLAAVYDFGTGGPTVMIRCELDALPIGEPNAFSYRSVVAGVSHKCGHDGHMAMVAGAVLWLKEQSFWDDVVCFLVILWHPAFAPHRFCSIERTSETSWGCILGLQPPFTLLFASTVLKPLLHDPPVPYRPFAIIDHLSNRPEDGE